jgi:HEAT repeat protein
VKPLSALLSDEDETVRAVAARALARIRTPEAARVLVGTLDNASELTRLRVAENLERVGPLAVEPLVKMLSIRKRRPPVMAARILGNLRAPEARPALKRTVRYGWNLDLRAQATLALGKIGDPEDVPALLSAAEDEEWPVRAQAANALGMIGETATIPTLKALMIDPEWWVRLNAARALAKLGPVGERALVEILEGADSFARHRAAATLEAQGITRQLVEELARPAARGERARRTIAAIIDAGSTKHLQRIAQTMPEREERRVLEEMLAERKRSSVAGAMKETSSDTTVNEQDGP